MPDDLGSLGQATVTIAADDSSYKAALAKLPATAAEADRKIKAAMAANRLKARGLDRDDPYGAMAGGMLDRQYAQLAGKRAAIENAVRRKAEAEADAARQREAERAEAARRKEEAREEASRRRSEAANRRFADRLGSRAGGGAGGGGNQGGRGGDGAYRLQQFAQIIDDLQYVPEMGLRPVLNNLSQISPILAVVGIAIDQVARHWSFFGSEAKKSLTPIEELEAKIKGLQAKPIKYSWDLAELDAAGKKLDQLKEKEETLGRLRKGRTEGEEKYGAAFDKVVSTTYGKVDGLLDSLAEARVEERRANQDPEVANPEGRAKAFRQARKDFEDDVVAASKGDRGRYRSLQDFAASSPSLRGVGLDLALKHGSPEVEAAGDRAKKQRERADDDLQSAVAMGQAELDRINEAKKKREEAAKEVGGLVNQKALQAELLRANAPVSQVGRQDVQSGLKEWMERGGVDPAKSAQLAQDVVDNALKEIDNKVKERLMDPANPVQGGAVAARSAVRDQLDREVRDDRRAQIQKEFGRAEMLDTGSYLNKLTLAGSSAMNDPTTKVVEEQKRTTAKVTELSTLAKQAVAAMLGGANASRPTLRTARYSKKA